MQQQETKRRLIHTQDDQQIGHAFHVRQLHQCGKVTINSQSTRGAQSLAEWRHSKATEQLLREETQET